MADYQLSWTTLPGRGGIACSEFRAVATPAPDRERGVAVTCATSGECEALVRHLEEHFARQRFANSAAAFETVKSYAIEWSARRGTRAAETNEPG